jgi:hypothetical protein
VWVSICSLELCWFKLHDLSLQLQLLPQ